MVASIYAQSATHYSDDIVGSRRRDAALLLLLNIAATDDVVNYELRATAFAECHPPGKRPRSCRETPFGDRGASTAAAAPATAAAAAAAADDARKQFIQSLRM